MTPVAFWVVNRNTDFSGGDYVDWHEVETVSVPKMLQECHKNPAAKLGDLSAVIKNNPRHQAGKPPRCGGSRLLIDTAFARQMAADKLAIQNAPIIAPTTGASSGTRK